MKKIRTAIAAFAIISITCLLSLKKAPASSIQGKISPAWYAVNAWAVNEPDTLYSTVTDGVFEFTSAKPGVYRIIIEAKSPYRNMALNNVVVKDGEETDVTVALQKY